MTVGRPKDRHTVRIEYPGQSGESAKCRLRTAGRETSRGWRQRADSDNVPANSALAQSYAALPYSSEDEAVLGGSRVLSSDEPSCDLRSGTLKVMPGIALPRVRALECAPPRVV